MQHPKWKVLSSQDVSASPWYPIVKEEVELPNGKTIEYFRSQLANSAMVVAITKQKELVFVKQYKHGIGEVCLEFPAGRIEDGQTAKQAAVKELEEETGIKVTEDELQELGELWTEPSKSSVRVKGFFITNVEINSEQHLDETEHIEVITVPLAEVERLVLRGQLQASDTLGMLMVAQTKFFREFAFPLDKLFFDET